MNKTLSGRLRALKNKGKVKLGNPKSGRGRLRDLFVTKFKSVQMGFHKGGPNQSWSLTRVVDSRNLIVYVFVLRSLNRI